MMSISFEGQNAMRHLQRCHFMVTWYFYIWFSFHAFETWTHPILILTSHEVYSRLFMHEKALPWNDTDFVNNSSIKRRSPNSVTVSCKMSLVTWPWRRLPIDLLSHSHFFRLSSLWALLVSKCCSWQSSNLNLELQPIYVLAWVIINVVLVIINVVWDIINAVSPIINVLPRINVFYPQVGHKQFKPHWFILKKPFCDFLAFDSIPIYLKSALHYNSWVSSNHSTPTQPSLWSEVWQRNDFGKLSWDTHGQLPTMLCPRIFQAEGYWLCTVGTEFNPSKVGSCCGPLPRQFHLTLAEPNHLTYFWIEWPTFPPDWPTSILMGSTGSGSGNCSLEIFYDNLSWIESASKIKTGLIRLVDIFRQIIPVFLSFFPFYVIFHYIRVLKCSYFYNFSFFYLKFHIPVHVFLFGTYSTRIFISIYILILRYIYISYLYFIFIFYIFVFTLFLYILYFTLLYIYQFSHPWMLSAQGLTPERKHSDLCPWQQT